MLHRTKIPFLCGWRPTWWWPSGPNLMSRARATAQLFVTQKSSNIYWIWMYQDSVSLWVKSSTAQNLMHKCQKLIGRFMKSNWAPSPARSWQKSLMWHYDVIECHRDWVQTAWIWISQKTSSMREHWCQDKIQGRWHVS